MPASTRHPLGPILSQQRGRRPQLQNRSTSRRIRPKSHREAWGLALTVVGHSSTMRGSIAACGIGADGTTRPKVADNAPGFPNIAP